MNITLPIFCFMYSYRKKFDISISSENNQHEGRDLIRRTHRPRTIERGVHFLAPESTSEPAQGAVLIHLSFFIMQHSVT
jgi:hypothetical protein